MEGKRRSASGLVDSCKIVIVSLEQPGLARNNSSDLDLVAIFSSTLRDRGGWAVEEVPHDGLMLSVGLFSLDSRI